MKELVSNDFLMSLENIKSNYVSNILFNLSDIYLTTTTAVLLSVDLKLSLNLITSGTKVLTVLLTSNYE